MVQSGAERDDGATEAGETESISPPRASTASKRQREGTGTVGAFGKRTGSSDLVFLEGILPETDDRVLSDLSTEQQTTVCLDRLESILSSRAVPLENVMKVEVQLTDIDDRAAVDGVYRTRFDGAYPPRTTVGVCALPGGAAVQLDVVAVDE